MPALVILIMAVFNSKGSAEGDQTQAATALRGLIAWPSASSTSDDICTGDDICNELNSMFFDKIDFVQKFKLVYIDILWLVTLSTKFAVWTIVLQKKKKTFCLIYVELSCLPETFQCQPQNIDITVRWHLYLFAMVTKRGWQPQGESLQLERGDWFWREISRHRLGRWNLVYLSCYSRIVNTQLPQLANQEWKA